MSEFASFPTRRDFLAISASAAAGAFPTAVAAARNQNQGESPVKAISSDNGRPATQRAYEMLLAGADTLDAVIAGVNIVEDDPNDMTVGYGGLPNEAGVVELDAAVMHGPTHGCGGVAALQGIRHPSKVARLVMQQTDHILLVGAGAQQFAVAHGFQVENLLTEQARKTWLKWKQNLSPDDDWLPAPAEPATRETAAWSFTRPTGTIHCAALNATGDLSCVTSTSGLAFKIPGRVGDSPLIGAGLYADNDIGSCGSTGRGEEVIRNAASFAAVELMRTGMEPAQAGLEVLRRLVKHTSRRLLDHSGRPTFNVHLYLLRKDGEHAGVSLFPGKFAVTDAQGTRLEPTAALFAEGK